jgi:hypothetical protein
MHPAGLFCTNLKKAVDNSPFSWYNNTRRQERHRLWGISSAGRALAWHARGQRFDPAILHQKSTILHVKYGAFLFAFLEVASRISQMPDFAGAWTTTPNSCYFVAWGDTSSGNQHPVGFAGRQLPVQNS